MEATVITLHGRQVCKLVDPVKLKFIKDTLSPYWNQQLIELGFKHQSKPIEILK